MTNESTQNQDNRIIYLYRITNLINGKFYIGQSIDPVRRWYEHKRVATHEKPGMLISCAIKKYGSHNFEFEVIASCKTWEDANELETILVTQYESHVSTGKGYNVTLGGYNAPKSEAWFKAMEEWRASLTPEKRAEISRKQSESFTKYLEENSHPAQGTKRTEEQRIHLSEVLKARDYDVVFSETVRQKMSESHIGHTDSEGTKQKKSESAVKAWEKRIDYSEIRCAVVGCKISGKAPYKIIDGIRYCFNHGQKLKRSETLEALPRHIQSNQSEEDRKKCGTANVGKIAHNRIIFTPVQINYILNSDLSMRKLAKEFEVTEKVIKRIKDGKY